MASVREETGLSVYRKLLVELSLELSTKDLETLKYAAVDFIPLGRTENMGSGLQFFDALEQDMRIGPRNLTLLQDMFKTIFRVDLAQRIQAFSKERAKFEADGNPNKIVSDKYRLLHGWWARTIFIHELWRIANERVSAANEWVFDSSQQVNKIVQANQPWSNLFIIWVLRYYKCL